MSLLYTQHLLAFLVAERWTALEAGEHIKHVWKQQIISCLQTY